MSKSLKKLIDINRLREFKNKLVGTGSAYVQTGAVDQTVAGTKTFSEPIVGSVTSSSGSCTGNAATATKLAAKRTIALSGAATGTATGFDGSGNITIPVTSLDASKLTGTASVSTTGNAATATTATTAKACTGNAATATTATTAKACTGNAATATKLATARSLWGNNFDGSAAITGVISGAPAIELMPAATSNIGGFIDFHYNHSTADYTSRIIESASGTLSVNDVTITTGKVVTATTFNGALKGNVTGNCSGSSGSCTGNAATATKATQDSDGNQINTTYSKNGHTHDDRYYTEAEVNNLLAGHTHNSVRTPDNNHVIGLDWSSQSSGFVGLSVDSNKQGGVVTTANLSGLLGGIGVYDIGSTILALTGTWVDYGHIIEGSGLRYAALDKNGGIYNLDISIGATGTWVKVSGNSSETSGFGLYRRIA